jgi:hypothetical protein
MAWSATSEGDGMSLSGAHRAAYRRDVPREGRVLSIRDRAGFPIARDADGTRALPFWSKRSRAAKVVAQVAGWFTAATATHSLLDRR